MDFVQLLITFGIAGVTICSGAAAVCWYQIITENKS